MLKSVCTQGRQSTSGVNLKITLFQHMSLTYQIHITNNISLPLLHTMPSNANVNFYLINIPN